jgi:hypothetical protein
VLNAAVDQTSGPNSTDAQAEQPQPDSASDTPRSEAQPGFRARGRARRRARFLSRARELAYRDLGGLVYNLHRFGQRNDSLVLAKLGTLGHIDDELRTIEAALRERRPVTVLREAGITACPRCAAIHGSEDRFCPNCGLPMSRHADLPVAGAPAGEPPAPAATPQTRYGAPPAGPATGQHQTGSYAASGAAQGTGRFPGAPPAAPAPAQPAHATSGPTAPAGPGFAASGQGTGRSPLPPERSVQPAPPQSAGAGPEEPTEIVRPQAPGS